MALKDIQAQLHNLTLSDRVVVLVKNEDARVQLTKRLSNDSFVCERARDAVCRLEISPLSPINDNDDGSRIV